LESARTTHRYGGAKYGTAIGVTVLLKNANESKGRKEKRAFTNEERAKAKKRR
jgi:hypothetical protein